MLPQSDLFPIGSRIRLKDGVSPGFYGELGLPGNEGIVRDTTREEYGYPRIYIEWDRGHWAYNGTPNMWTWQDHFELVEDSPMSEKKEDLRDLLAEFISRLDDNEEDREDNLLGEGDFDETLKRAIEDAKTSQAFVVITLNEETFPGGPGDFVVPVAYHAARDRKSSLICQMQLGDLSQQFQERLVKEKLDHGDGKG